MDEEEQWSNIDRGSSYTLTKIFIPLYMSILCPFLYFVVPICFAFYVLFSCLSYLVRLPGTLLFSPRAKEVGAPRRPPLPVYRSSNNVLCKDQIQDVDCAICLRELLNAPNDVVVLRFCNHMYHLSCMEEWATRNKSCPICRRVVNRFVVFKIITADEKSSNPSTRKKFRSRNNF